MIKWSFCFVYFETTRVNENPFTLGNSFVIYLVPPLYIHIQGLNHPLTSGVKVHLSCSTAGARPIPQIVWTKGSQVMQGASQTVRSVWIAKIIINFTYELLPNWLFPQTSANGNITTSDIVYLPTPEDNTKVIACSVPVEEKNNAPTLSIKDTRILDIKRKRPLTLPLDFESIIGQFCLRPQTHPSWRCRWDRIWIPRISPKAPTSISNVGSKPIHQSRRLSGTITISHCIHHVESSLRISRWCFRVSQSILTDNTCVGRPILKAASAATTYT